MQEMQKASRPFLLGRKPIQDEFTGKGTRGWRWAMRNKKKGNCLHGSHAPEKGKSLCRMHLDRLSWAQAARPTKETITSINVLNIQQAAIAKSVLVGLGK